jgi:hypothetical protein
MEASTFDLVRFRARLAETIAWCTPRATADDPRNCLRSAELRPPSLLETAVEILNRSQPTNSEPGAYERRFAQVLTERQAVVNALAEKRQALLRRSPGHGNASASQVAGGRLLVFKPDDTLEDGAAEVGSQGFFDVSNVPPWDSWVDYIIESAEQQSHIGQWEYSACRAGLRHIRIF